MSPDILWATLIFVISLLYFSSFAFYGVNTLDEGYLFNPALRILGGELPGRDYYHFYPPGRFYLFALLFGIFGPTMAVGRVGLAVLRAFECLLAWRLGGGLTSRRWGIMAWMGIMACPGPAHKVFFGISVLGTLLALNWATGAASPKRWFLYGMSLGLVLLFRQDVAVFGVIVGCLAMFLCNANSGVKPFAPSAKGAALCALGVVAAASAPLIYWVYKGALAQIIAQMFSAARMGNRANAIPYPLPLEVFTGGALNALRVLLFYLPIIVYAWGAVYLLRLRFRPGDLDMKSEVKKRAPLRVMLFATTAMGILCMNQARVRSDLPHLYQAIAPVFVLAPALCYHALRSWRKAAALLPLILAATQTFSDNSLYHGTISVVMGRRTELRLPAGGALKLSEFEAKELRETLDFIDERSGSGDYILVVPDAPLLYFLSGRRNPTPYELMRMGRFDSPEKEKKVVEALTQHPPALVVYRDEAYLPYKKRFEYYAPLAQRFINSNYLQVGRAISFNLFLPINEAAPRIDEPAQ